MRKPKFAEAEKEVGICVIPTRSEARGGNFTLKMEEFRRRLVLPGDNRLRGRFRILLGTILSIGLMCVLTAAASHHSSPLTGTWDCTSHNASQGDMAFTLDLTQNRTVVTGDVSSPLGDADISSASFKNNHLKIIIEGSDTDYKLIATYMNGTLSGTWSTSDGNQSGTWRGKMQPSSKP